MRGAGMRKIKLKRRIIVLIAVILISGFLPGNLQRKIGIQSEVKAISDKKLFKKYNAWMKQNRGGFWSLNCIDIDENGIMEAIVDEGLFGRIIVLTYSNKTGKISELIYLDWSTKKAAFGVKKKKLYISIISSKETTTSFYSLKRGKAKKVKTAVCVKGKDGKKKYTINKKKVKNSEYNKLFKGYHKKKVVKNFKVIG